MQGTTLQWSLIALLQTNLMKTNAFGFSNAKFFTGFGQTLANLSLFFPMILLEKQALPTWVYASFFLESRLFYRKYLVEYENQKRSLLLQPN
jgi:hypothetical protein